jgi:succinate dehydrogenase hydrophobic anchor subunit
MFSLFQKKNSPFGHNFGFFYGEGVPQGGNQREGSAVIAPHRLSSIGPTLTTKTKSIETLRHWIAIRVTSIILIPFFFILLFGFIFSVQVYYFDVYNVVSLIVFFMFFWVEKSFWIKIGLVSFFAILSIHLVKGNEDVMTDYIHHEKTRIFSFFLLKCIQIELIKYIYFFIIF